MNRFLVVVLIALPCAAMAESKSTKSTPAPSKMSTLDAAKLDAAVMHREIIMQRALSVADPFEREIQRICKLYNIDPQQLGKTVGVDPETGAIQRVPDPPVVTSTPTSSK